MEKVQQENKTNEEETTQGLDSLVLYHVSHSLYI